MKKIISSVVVALIIGSGSFAFAADPVKMPSTQMQPVGSVVAPVLPMMCPPGWHKTISNTEQFTCEPNKPAPMKCPEGWKYVEAIKCINGIQLGGGCNPIGCSVGCVKIQVPK
jgi:hypothetical protein